MAGAMTGAAPAEGGKKTPWPELRDELRLYPGPANRWGAPTWTLHDPTGQRFFRLGWMEMEVLQRWRLGDPAAIAQSVSGETTLALPPDAVTMVYNFVNANNLAVSKTPDATATLVKQKKARKKSALSTLMHNYLFLRISLFRPDAFLSATVGWVEWMFSRAFVAVLLSFAALGLFLVLREWALFRDTLSSLLTLQGGLLAAAALGLSKCLHEFGHAYAAKRLGLRVPGMGIALMCFAPVLWTDTTEAWKLPKRRDRLSIGVAGVMAELILATCASLAWPVLPEGPLKTAAFMLAGSVWILTLAVNVNPLMRYDGYYLLSDYWDLPGLQTRSFGIAKWFLREQLFGYGLPPPEPFPFWDRWKLIIYAFCVWVYRFFLFLGIALMVYYLFFKALGIVLMLVELVFFIAMPILMEVAHWIRNRDKMRLNWRLLRTGVIFAGLGWFAFAPWYGRVGGPALLTRERRAVLYAPKGGVVETVAAANGVLVEPGTPLFQMRSPDLEAQIEIARSKVAAQRLRLSMGSLDLDLRVELAAEWDQLEQLAEDLAGLLRERSNLELKAPFVGRIVDMPEWLVAGSWVQGKEPLAALVGGERIVQVYVAEYERSRVNVGDAGLFYPSGRGREPVALRITEVERQATREIVNPELTSVYGGPLGAHRLPDGRLEAEQAVFKVTCTVEGESPDQLMVGYANLEAERQSLVTDVWRKFLGLLVRESGF